MDTRRQLAASGRAWSRARGFALAVLFGSIPVGLLTRSWVTNLGVTVFYGEYPAQDHLTRLTVAVFGGITITVAVSVAWWGWCSIRYWRRRPAADRRRYRPTRLLAAAAAWTLISAGLAHLAGMVSWWHGEGGLEAASVLGRYGEAHDLLYRVALFLPLGSGVLVLLAWWTHPASATRTGWRRVGTLAALAVPTVPLSLVTGAVLLLTSENLGAMGYGNQVVTTITLGVVLAVVLVLAIRGVPRRVRTYVLDIDENAPTDPERERRPSPGDSAPARAPAAEPIERTDQAAERTSPPAAGPP